ncbi:hypothetical protein BDY21DRAFT_398904 [Lineolata rhizophorae]|uniref:dolichol kinase n=1 Tax=Lineolata rhizophorae TaxID=578093 RepID=A0A6A6NSS0_9PEZI|nr:hypothetical protein BDY21DRAFT_398904 [Lineolata rhizophorae]
MSASRDFAPGIRPPHGPSSLPPADEADGTIAHRTRPSSSSSPLSAIDGAKPPTHNYESSHADDNNDDTDADTADPPNHESSPTSLFAEADNLRFFTRSPHPYHRIAPPHNQHKPTLHAASSLHPPDASGGRREPSTSAARTPSESGTEADDEGYGFVRALPPAPVRPRKGLKVPAGEREARRRRMRAAGVEGGAKGEGMDGGYFDGTGDQRGMEEERRKVAKKRRAEILRRGAETALLGVVGGLVVLKGDVWGVVRESHRAEVLAHVLTVAILFMAYPVRLFYYLSRTYPQKDRRLRLRLPTTFDPAPLLYPTFLPPFVALALSPAYPKILLPNIVLSLAALPPQVIPFYSHQGSYSMPHWLVSLIPLMAAQNTALPSKLFPPKPYQLRLPSPEGGIEPELIASLFALHQSLLPPLYFLTTTSLLPAELQLLSIALINVLLFSVSPQSVIICAMLWVGGLPLFVMCGNVLRWNVALARIPKWRLRRVGHIIKARQSFIQALTDGLQRSRRGMNAGARQDVSESDADEDLAPTKEHHQSQQQGTTARLLNLDIKGISKLLLADSQPWETRSAVERPRDAEFPGKGSPAPPVANADARRRRHSVSHTDVGRPNQQHNHGHSQTKSASIQAYLSLTPAQAARRKWIYAGYVYAMMAGIILFPVRLFVQWYALDGQEPFGWAAGYMLGNVPDFRAWVVRLDLEGWICLPPLSFPEDEETSGDAGHKVSGLVPRIRHDVLGEANTRLALSAYCVAILVLGMLAVLRLSSVVEVDTRRKVFHGMMVAMLLPTTYVDPAFVALALAIVLALFLLLDLLRASQLPPLSRPLAYFLTPYVDGRDLRGPVVVSHIFLLIGCAIPLWLSLAGAERTAPPLPPPDAEAAHAPTHHPWLGWELPTREPGMVAGVVCVGMGDAAASLVGRRYGRRKWPWPGGKSLEGSAAFAAAVAAGLGFGVAWLRFGGWAREAAVAAAAEGAEPPPPPPEPWCWVLPKLALAATGASFMEAVLTGGNDNVVVPVVLWLLVRGVGL